MGKARSGTTFTQTVDRGLTVTSFPFKSVFFSKRQILELINNVNNPDPIEGIMLRPKESGSVYETLDAIKLTKSMFTSELDDFIVNTQLPSQKGKPLETGIPPSFQGLGMFGFAFFPISTIQAMLSVIQTSDPDKSGLIFRLVVVELDSITKEENRRHLSLAVSPNTVNNPIVAGEGLGFSLPDVREFITYSIGFVCPPIWPPNYLEWQKQLGISPGFITRQLSRPI
jgi:hypothetical protein